VLRKLLGTASDFPVRYDQEISCDHCNKTLAKGKVEDYNELIKYSLCRKKECKDQDADVFVLTG